MLAQAVQAAHLTFGLGRPWGFLVGASTLDVFRLGILFSTNGYTAALGRDCRDRALLAIAELEAELGPTLRLEPIVGDPEGVGDRYIAFARRMAAEDECRHIVGSVTSEARMDVIPAVEKYDAQLWHVCPSKGFEANPNVIYTGACPNQHLVPLFAYLLPTEGRRVYFAGANYVWGWEMNRLARELVTDAEATIVGERCLPLAETDVARLMAEVEARRPDFILSNLVGPANHAFLRAMRELGKRDATFRPERRPVVSCDLTECELPEIGIGLADGQLATASFFDSLDTPQGRILKTRVAVRFGMSRRVSCYFATRYATMRLCVEAALQCDSDDPAKLRAALGVRMADGALGPLRVDPATHHAGLPFLLARVAGDSFAILQSQPSRAADPYLTGLRPRTALPSLQARRHPEPYERDNGAPCAAARPSRPRGGVPLTAAHQRRRCRSRAGRRRRGLDGAATLAGDRQTRAAHRAPGLEGAWPCRLGLDQGADAMIAKPVMPSADFPALVMAARRHAEAREMAGTLAEMRERMRLHALVIADVERLREARGWSEDEAYRQMRHKAMR